LDTQLNNKEFDAIVVGSGPGGATVARELSKRKKTVLILERGDDGPLNEGFRTIAAILNTVSVSDNIESARAFATGGTTAVYFAVADSPPLDMFLSLGIDISKDLEQSKRELPLAVLPDGLLNPQAIRVRESAIDLGYAWEKKPMLVDLSKCSSGYSYESKWNARSFLHEAVEQGAILRSRARVLRVLVDKNKAIGVEYDFRKGKKEHEVRQAFGARIILAAGASASPIILRDSGVRHIANAGFYCHPSFGVFGTVSGLKAGENFVGSMGAKLEDDIGLGDANFGRILHRMSMLASRRFIRAFCHSRSIGVGVMVKEGLGGGLQADGRYYKQLKKEDLKKLEKAEYMARQIIQNAGGKHIFKSSLGSAHMGGTIRIKEHLDANLQTEYSNLHVCDASVIPENAKIAPALTLVCLGKYLANRLMSTL